MPVYNIKIRASNTSTQRLDLDFPHRRANRGDTIRWKIMPQSGVDKIVLIGEKPGSENIFSGRGGKLPSVVTQGDGAGSDWEAIISEEASECAIYIYGITWGKGVNNYEYDPIISINPSTGLLKDFISPLFGIIVGGLATLIFWLMDRKKLKTEIEYLKRQKLKDGQNEN